MSYIYRGAAYGELGNHEAGDFGSMTGPSRSILNMLTAYINRGAAYDKLGNYRQAISDYDRAIEINPEYA